MTTRTEQIEKIAQEENCSLSTAKKKYYSSPLRAAKATTLPSKWATDEEIAREIEVRGGTRTQAIARITYRKKVLGQNKDGPDVVGLWQKTSKGWILLKRN